MQDIEISPTIQNENLQIAIGKLWNLLRSLVQQMNSLSLQNQEIKTKLLDSKDLNIDEWIELEKYNELVAVNNNLNEQISTLNSEIFNLKNEGNSDSGNITENYLEEISKLKQSLSEYEITKRTLNEKNLVVLTLNDEISELKNQLTNERSKLEERTDMSEEIAALIKEKNDLLEIIEKSKTEIAEKNWIINEFEKSISEKSQKIKTLTELSSELEKDHKFLSESLNAKENDFNLLRTEKEQLEIELTKVKITARDLNKQIENMKKMKKEEITLFDTDADELKHFKNEKISLLERIEELQMINSKMKSDLNKTRSGLLPLAFENDNDLQNQIDVLQVRIANENEQKKNLENKLFNLENLLILKSEEIQKFEKLVEQNKNEFFIHNNKLKSKILDLKKFMIDKGII